MKLSYTLAAIFSATAAVAAPLAQLPDLAGNVVPVDAKPLSSVGPQAVSDAVASGSGLIERPNEILEDSAASDKIEDVRLEVNELIVTLTILLGTVPEVDLDNIAPIGELLPKARELLGKLRELDVLLVETPIQKVNKVLETRGALPGDIELTPEILFELSSAALSLIKGLGLTSVTPEGLEALKAINLTTLDVEPENIPVTDELLTQLPSDVAEIIVKLELTSVPANLFATYPLISVKTSDVSVADIETVKGLVL